ncbi:hypothetical protein [Nocardioides ochotonae]|uniref:hypothetical protein n=1 Tax=Nocardioides ochotonae TaxID=2685869 RepID=UPI001409AE28|nr:hypothetical protein [Nocardioides ochotonae]
MLKDSMSLLPLFADLVAVCSSADASTPAESVGPIGPTEADASLDADASVEGAVSPRALSDEERVPEPPAPDPRGEELRAYVRQARERGPWNERLDDAWVVRVLADSTALAEMPANVARKHKPKIQELLGVGLLVPGPTPGAAAELFTATPSIDRHEATHQVSFTPGVDGATELTWQGVPPGDFAWFKVFAGVGMQLPLLYEGRLVGQGERCSVTDFVPVTSGWRQYAVWVHHARDVKAAAAERPRLWARGVLVASVADVRVAVRARHVTATWSVDASVDRVEVHRFLAADAPSLDVVSDMALISGDLEGMNLTGFEDHDVPPGDYVYRFYAVSVLDGVVHRSAPFEAEASVEVLVLPVQRLHVEHDEAEGRIKASWDDVPGAKVELHCTREDLGHGIRDNQLDRAGLERAGLGEPTRVNAPAVMEDGRWTVHFDWPDAESRVHLVAVSAADGAYRVGASEVCVRLGMLAQPVLHERVDEQYLTFPWPDGASKVVLRQQGHKEETDPHRWQEIGDIDRGSHKRYGGLRVPGLPAEGCKLALVPFVSEGRAQKWGIPRILDYPGLHRVSYSLGAGSAPAPAARSHFWQRKETHEVVPSRRRIEVLCEPAAAVTVVLVSLQHRLPLHADDTEPGRESRRWQLGTLRADGRTSSLSVDLPAVHEEGWFRLFVDVSADEQPRYAVLDPEVSQLKGDSR